MGRRYRSPVPARRAPAFFRYLLENGRGESRYAAGIYLQHRREPLGPLEGLAAGVRGLRYSAEAALSAGELWLGIRETDRVFGRRGRRHGFLCFRPLEAGSLSSASGSICRFGPVEAVAGNRSARRGGPDRRVEV